MSKLDDILTDTGSTLFCMGQDWTRGDGSATRVDEVVGKTKQQIKDLFLELLEASRTPDNDELLEKIKQGVNNL